MNLTEREIEWIVGEVVRRLQALTKSPATQINNTHNNTHSSQLTLTDRLITLEALRDKLPTLKQLVVSTKAIVTPAVKDELKRHGIQLLRGSQPNITTTQNQPSTKTQLLAANFASDYRRESLASLIAGLGANLQHYPASQLDEQIATQCEQVTRTSQRAIWFSNQPAHAACLANRHEKVWAIVAHDVESLTIALKSTAANVLIIDPCKKSQYVLRQMLSAFVG